jgi:DnaD/phage-associated family protein
LINAFYDRLETNQLSTSAIALWHALANVNNKAGWPKVFGVARSVLCIKTGLSDRTVTNARNELKLKGYIDFKSRNGSKSAVYELKDLSAMIAYKVSEKSLPAIDSRSASDNVSHNVSHNASRLVSPLVVSETKREETKQQHAVSREHWFDEYYQCFGSQLNAVQCRNITVYLEQDGLEDAVICKAFKMAASIGKSYGYAVGILNNWAAKGIKTLDDVAEEQKSHQAERQKKTVGQSSIHREVIPAWIGGKEKQPKPPQNPEEAQKRAKWLDQYLNSI